MGYVCVLSYLSNVQLCATPDSVASQGSSVHGILQARILECVAMPSSGDLPDPGIEPTSLCLLHWQAGSLPLAPPGKPEWTIDDAKPTWGETVMI